jgi:hypothetical protein
MDLADEMEGASTETYIPTPLNPLKTNTIDLLVKKDKILEKPKADNLKWRVKAIEGDMGNLGTKIKKRKIKDSLMFAQIPDELDAILNAKMED